MPLFDSRSGHWLRRWLLGLALLAVLAPAAAEPVAITLQQAEVMSVGLEGDLGAPTPVALPDSWGLRGLRPQGLARYRLAFTLAEVPVLPWALSFTRVSSSRRVFLNGTLVEDESETGRRLPESDVIELPTALLRPGGNQIELEVDYRARAGLSEAALGPAAALHAQADRHALWERELPRALNTGIAIVAALMLLIRWRRPSETTIALFGALALLGSLRNYAYFADVSLLQSGLTDWLFYSVQVWTAALFVTFARSVGVPRERPWFRPLLLGASVALPLLAALTIPLGGLPELRALSYPLLLVLGATGVVLIRRGARRHGRLANRALVACFSAVVAAGAHDYVFQQGHLPITSTFWMPFAMPFALGLYAMVLLNRFVGAIGEVEALRDTLEAQVEQRTRALATAVAAKTRFLAAASHDLRQPAVAIGLMIGLVRERALAPDVRRMIDRAHQAVGALEALLQGLLDLSRLDSGTVRPRLTALPLQAAFDAIQSHEAEVAAAKGLRLRFRAHGLAVHCDAQLLDQLLRNLVANALRYTERGGVLVVARARGPERVLVQVWDSGVGIAPEHQAEVFDEFVQVDNPGRDSAHGLGLGLALVKRCAALLGTRVQLHSRPGRGSCFSLLLPRLERRGVARPALPVPVAAPLAGRYLLVIDDDAAVREALRARLEAWGARVDAFDGLPALHGWLAAGPARPDMLLTDQQLGAGTGLQVVEAVRARFGALPALLVTGNTAPEEIARLAASGVPLLHKPFRAEVLLAAIEKASGGFSNRPSAGRDRPEPQPEARGGHDGLRA
ncbi:MAG TPA: hybrid sensor histidine kinase/response regulator [Burkholderiaceae bacterium]